jgi:hypothetical protein
MSDKTPDPTSARPDAPAVVWCSINASGYVEDAGTDRAQVIANTGDPNPVPYARVPDVATLDAEIAALDNVIVMAEDVANFEEDDAALIIAKSMLARLRALREAVDVKGGTTP